MTGMMTSHNLLRHAIFHSLQATTQKAVLQFNGHHLIAFLGSGLGDAMTHEAKTDDADFGDLSAGR